MCAFCCVVWSYFFVFAVFFCTLNNRIYIFDCGICFEHAIWQGWEKNVDQLKKNARLMAIELGSWKKKIEGDWQNLSTEWNLFSLIKALRRRHWQYVTPSVRLDFNLITIYAMAGHVFVWRLTQTQVAIFNRKIWIKWADSTNGLCSKMKWGIIANWTLSLILFYHFYPASVTGWIWFVGRSVIRS